MQSYDQLRCPLGKFRFGGIISGLLIMTFKSDSPEFRKILLDMQSGTCFIGLSHHFHLAL